MSVTPDEIETIIQQFYTGKLPSKIKDDNQEIEFRLPSLQQLMQALSNANATNDGDSSPFNLVEFNDSY